MQAVVGGKGGVVGDVAEKGAGLLARPRVAAFAAVVREAGDVWGFGCVVVFDLRRVRGG